MTASNILIVDDNLASRQLLLAIFRHSPYNILQACNGAEALETICRTKPDLVLLDIEMPVLDGIAVIRKLKQDLQLASIPVLAVTADAMQGTRERILSEGFDGFVTKPIDGSFIRQRVREILGH